MAEEYLRICEDCGAPYFTAGEQAFYENKNLTLPKRCKKCRTARKQEWEQEQKAKKLIEQAEFFKQALIAAPFKSVSIDSFPTGKHGDGSCVSLIFTNIVNRYKVLLGGACHHTNFLVSLFLTP